MVELGGGIGRVASRPSIRPASSSASSSTTVRLSPADVVEDAQGASVELVRNVGTGTKIALSTPSGLQSALTSDRRANIARIAGITAGAPDVVPLPA